MHGAGNDFLIVESQGERRDWESLSRTMCDRHFGAGADGLMLLLPSDRADIGMRLFNADGSEAEVTAASPRHAAVALPSRPLTPYWRRT